MHLRYFLTTMVMLELLCCAQHNKSITKYLCRNVLYISMYMVLSAHKGKTGTEFYEKFLNMFNQPYFHITFVILVGESQHIEYVRVF